ncbi:MAG: CzcE family metal-binding protein [Burkholderiaceae bacterium]
MNNKLALSGAALVLLTSVAAQAAPRADLFGDVDTEADAARTVVIQPDTRFVNVTHGEVVRFVDGDQTFAVRFDGTANAFALNALAPAGTLDHPVTAFVAPNPAADY